MADWRLVLLLNILANYIYCLSTVRYVIDFNFASITLALWLTAEWTSLSPVSTSYLWPVLFAELLNYVFIT